MLIAEIDTILLFRKLYVFMVVTSETFYIQGDKFRRIYFHTPVSFSEVLDAYGEQMISLFELLELRKNYSDKEVSQIHSWNLCPEEITCLTEQRALFNESPVDFINSSSSQIELYLGISLLPDAVRVCLLSPQKILYLDASIDWVTFGFGIILTEKEIDSTKSIPANLKIRNLTKIKKK